MMRYIDKVSGTSSLSLALDTLCSLSDCGAFRSWLDALKNDETDLETVLSKSVALKSTYKIICYRLLGNDPNWSIILYPFSDENIKVDVMNSDIPLKLQILSLIKRSGQNSFSYVDKNSASSKFYYKLFMYDEFLNRYIESGLVLFLFLQAIKMEFEIRDSEKETIYRIIEQTNPRLKEPMNNIFNNINVTLDLALFN